VLNSYLKNVQINAKKNAKIDFLDFLFKWTLDQIMNEKQPKNYFKMFKRSIPARMHLIKLVDKIKVRFLLFLVQSFDR